MARFAIIDAGRVTNIIEADADFAATIGAIDATGAGIGDLWDGETFTPAPAPTPVIPQEVTMRQARLALLGAGLLSQVDAAIASLTDPDKSTAMIDWEYAAVVQRSSGLVPAMGAALGMTEAQIDSLFVTAATL